MKTRQSGFSLLEVILAMAILTGGIAVIGELVRQAMDCSRYARLSAQAQLICQSKLEEIAAGSALPTAVDWSDPGLPVNNTAESTWLYSVQVSQPSAQNMLLVKVLARPNVPPQARLVQVSLSRWMLDPTYVNTLKQNMKQAQTDAQAAADARANSASTSTTSSTSATSTTGTSAG
jgi:general secretion pathway protein I